MFFVTDIIKNKNVVKKHKCFRGIPKINPDGKTDEINIKIRKVTKESRSIIVFIIYY